MLPRRLTAASAGAGATALVLSAAALAGSGPQAGTYSGHSSTNVTGNPPLNFTMSVAKGTCAAPGGRSRRKAFCVIVDATSLIQSPCAGSDFVADAFFPATEPIALSSSRAISHTYALYSSAGSPISDRKFPGGAKVGSFSFSLKLSMSGTATGSMHYAAGDSQGSGTCDSGVVSITAKRKAPR